MILHLFFRLGIWFLLTSDFSPANIMIGMAVAFVLPKPPISFPLREWLPVFARGILMLPQAYKEAIEMMIFPHRYEGLQLEKVRHGRPDFLIFLDIFFITFTPKTVVIKYHKEGWYEVHKVKRHQLIIHGKQK